MIATRFREWRPAVAVVTRAAFAPGSGKQKAILRCGGRCAWRGVIHERALHMPVEAGREQRTGPDVATRGLVEIGAEMNGLANSSR
jgi:hypothetical protein